MRQPGYPTKLSFVTILRSFEAAKLKQLPRVLFDCSFTATCVPAHSVAWPVRTCGKPVIGGTCQNLRASPVNRVTCQKYTAKPVRSVTCGPAQLEEWPVTTFVPAQSAEWPVRTDGPAQSAEWTFRAYSPGHLAERNVKNTFCTGTETV